MGYKYIDIKTGRLWRVRPFGYDGKEKYVTLADRNVVKG